MKPILAAAAFVVTGICAPAFAATAEAPPADNTAAEIIARLDAMGYDTKGLDRSDATYRVRIVDRRTGGIVQAIFDTSTTELLQARLEEQDGTSE